MANPKLAPGEHILVNVTATMRAMLFPTLELLLITGLGWMIIGYFDRIPTYDELGVQTGLTLSVQGRNMLVVAWMVLGFLRFVLPLVRACRSRLVVTTSRMLLRAPGLTTSLDTIPLVGIYNASRRRPSTMPLPWRTTTLQGRLVGATAVQVGQLVGLSTRTATNHCADQRAGCVSL